MISLIFFVGLFMMIVLIASLFEGQHLIIVSIKTIILGFVFGIIFAALFNVAITGIFRKKIKKEVYIIQVEKDFKLKKGKHEMSICYYPVNSGEETISLSNCEFYKSDSNYVEYIKYELWGDVVFFSTKVNYYKIYSTDVEIKDLELPSKNKENTKIVCQYDSIYFTANYYKK